MYFMTSSCISHCCRSQKYNNGYGEPINSELIMETSYTDLQPFEGTNHYLVKAVKITETASGSYTNMSLGISDSITNIKGTSSNTKLITQSEIKIYPTLVHNQIFIQKKDAQPISYIIQNSLGMNVITGTILSPKESIDLLALKSGVYYLLINGYSQKFIKYER